MYTYARIQSIRRRHDGWPSRTPKRQKEAFEALKTSKELKLVKKLADWPTELHRAATDLDPGTLTSFLFELSQHFSSLYNDEHHRIVDIEDKDRRDGLLLLCRATGKVLSYGLELLGIETLDQM
jgi:arginyl-tRNA synthetase